MSRLCVSAGVHTRVERPEGAREAAHGNTGADPSYSLTWRRQPWFVSVPADETLLYVLFTSCLDYRNCLLAGPTCLSSPMGSKCC